MRASRPRHVVALAVMSSGFLAGCVFNNTLHNAEGFYQEAENFRLVRQDSAGRARYDEVVATEISRDVLAAPRLSSEFFEAYATARPDAPWAGKALLASRELTSDPAQRKWLDRRIETLPADAYIRYPRSGHSAPELGGLESRLQDALDQLLERVDEQLLALRQLAGVPKE